MLKHTLPTLSLSVTFSTLLSSENNYLMGGGVIGCEKRWKTSEEGRHLVERVFSLFQNETLGGQRDFWYDNKEEHLCGSSYFPEHRSGLRMVPGLAQAPCLSRTV